MCLTNIKIEDVPNKKRVYKHLSVELINRRISLCSQNCDDKKWFEGKHISNRNNSYIEDYEKKSYNSINLGFHVYPNPPYSSCILVMVVFTAYKDDYIASGYNNGESYSKGMVYNKLTLEKREYERALKRAKKLYPEGKYPKGYEYLEAK